MQEKIKELKENCILGISNWWGLGNAGNSGTIITKDKMIYHYHSYFREPSFFKEENIPKESLSNGKPITEKQYSKIVKFIEKEIVGKTYDQPRIFDAGYNVYGFYNGKPFNISNNIDLYKKVKELM